MGYALKKLRASYADIEALPAHITGELIAGQLYTQPRPFLPHAHAIGTIFSELRNPFFKKYGGPGGWILVIEPEIHFRSGDVLVPDLAGWRRERWITPANKQHITLAPDWVCEVLSESTEVVDRGIKMEIYGQHHVSHVWLIDPIECIVEVYRHEQGQYSRTQYAQGSQSVRLEPFASLELELSSLWSFS